jgi:hypothetical protein
MHRRTAASGEGMQQDRSRGHKVGSMERVRTTLLRAALGVVCVGLVAGVDASAARAQTYGSDSGSAWSKIMQTFGMNKPADANSEINYTERSPLVVPPNRDLPAPASTAPPSPDWPKDPAVKYQKRAKPKVQPDPAVPSANEGTVAAAGGNAPPPAVPNPPFEKKTWYNPISWFNKEEYATFTGEPGRDRLTDPPVGYRVPSPDQPYGLGPDKKTAKGVTASDMMLTPATGQSGH